MTGELELGDEHRIRPSHTMIHTLWDGTGIDDKLRKLFIDSFIHHGDPQWLSAWGTLPTEFVQSVFSGLIRVRGQHPEDTLNLDDYLED
jgi:hypothetical protein